MDDEASPGDDRSDEDVGGRETTPVDSDRLPGGPDAGDEDVPQMPDVDGAESGPGRDRPAGNPPSGRRQPDGQAPGRASGGDQHPGRGQPPDRGQPRDKRQAPDKRQPHGESAGGQQPRDQGQPRGRAESRDQAQPDGRPSAGSQPRGRRQGGQSATRARGRGGRAESPPREGPDREAAASDEEGADAEGEAESDEEERGGWLTRRRALAGTLLLGVGAMGAGVLSIMNPPQAPPPSLPTEEMQQDGWVQTDQAKEVLSRSQVGPVTVTAIGNRLNFGDQGLLDAVRNSDVTLEIAGQRATRTLGEVAPDAIQQHLAIFVATRIDLGPDVDNAPFGLGRAQVMDQVESTAERSFVQTMRDAGLENVRRTDEGSLDIQTGETATYKGYAGAVPFQGGTFTESGEEFTIPATTLEMAGHLAVWHHEDWVMIGAGAHPAANYAPTFDEQLSTGHTATLSLDLGLRPATHREELLGYVRRMR